MNSKKPRRKSLDDALAQQFVYGGDDTSKSDSITEEKKPSTSKKPEAIKKTSPQSEAQQSQSDRLQGETENRNSTIQEENQPLRKKQKKVEREVQDLSTKNESDSANVSNKTSRPDSKSKINTKESSLMEKLQVQPKEVTKRFTVDLPESMHRKLSILAAKTARTKADIVRLLLQDALEDIED
jgi:hypothetical protein